MKVANAVYYDQFLQLLRLILHKNIAKFNCLIPKIKPAVVHCRIQLLLHSLLWRTAWNQSTPPASRAPENAN